MCTYLFSQLPTYIPSRSRVTYNERGEPWRQVGRHQISGLQLILLLFEVIGKFFKILKIVRDFSPWSLPVRETAITRSPEDKILLHLFRFHFFSHSSKVSLDIRSTVRHFAVNSFFKRKGCVFFGKSHRSQIFQNFGQPRPNLFYFQFSALQIQ